MNNESTTTTTTTTTTATANCIGNHVYNVGNPVTIGFNDSTPISIVTVEIDGRVEGEYNLYNGLLLRFQRGDGGPIDKSQAVVGRIVSSKSARGSSFSETPY